jgi:hypothetical protein
VITDRSQAAVQAANAPAGLFSKHWILGTFDPTDILAVFVAFVAKARTAESIVY